MVEEVVAAPVVIVEVRGRLGHIILNRPRAINALNEEMVAIVASTLERWKSDDAVQTVLITGAGERGLCAGGDIVSIYHDAREGGTSSETFWRDEYELNAQIADYPKPYVAIQSGVVLGGGIGISAHGSIRIVTESSKLGMPETGIGFVPDIGGTYLLSRGSSELGTHLALTAGSVGPADAIAVGLSDSFVAGEQLADFVAALETEDAAAAMSRFASQPPTGELEANRSWIDVAYAGDDVQGILDRLANLDNASALAAFEAISTKSPTALKATLASLRKAREATDLWTVLVQEFRVSLHFLLEPDLAEGIRAQVIEKDRNPQWKPATLAEVDDDHVESLFASLGDRELLSREESA